METFSFPSELVELKNHDVSHETITVDSRDCLEYLTENADPMEILEDPLIKNNQTLLWQMAAADTPVDLFERGERKTWNGVNYSPMVKVVHEEIAPHMSQCQRVESHVQTNAIVSRTNVGEARRTSRATVHTALHRTFNQESVEEKRESSSLLNVRRLKDSERISKYIPAALELIQRIHPALEHFTEEQQKEVLANYRTSKNKTSTEECNQKCEMYRKGIKRKRKVTKAEYNPNGMDITAEMDGKIKLVYLCSSTSPNQIEEVHAEILERGIVLPMPLEQMAWQDKKNLLKEDEYKKMVIAGLARNINGWKEITQITPYSEEMLGLREYQRECELNKQNKKQTS